MYCYRIQIKTIEHSPIVRILFTYFNPLYYAATESSQHIIQFIIHFYDWCIWYALIKCFGSGNKKKKKSFLPLNR